MSELRATTLTRWRSRLFLFAVPPSWAAQAGCAEADPELFFPPDGERSDTIRHLTRMHAAKAVCASCLVRAECLTYAVDTHQHDGVWGGLAETERGALVGATPRKAQP